MKAIAKHSDGSMRYTVTVSLVTPDNTRARRCPMFGLPDMGNSLSTTAAIARDVVDPFHAYTAHVYVWDEHNNVGHSATLPPDA